MLAGLGHFGAPARRSAAEYAQCRIAAVHTAAVTSAFHQGGRQARPLRSPGRPSRSRKGCHLVRGSRSSGSIGGLSRALPASRAPRPDPSTRFAHLRQRTGTRCDAPCRPHSPQSFLGAAPRRPQGEADEFESESEPQSRRLNSAFRKGPI